MSTTTDMEMLLALYIKHVRQCEGVDYINEGWVWDQTLFNKEQWSVLDRLSRWELSEITADDGTFVRVIRPRFGTEKP